MTSLLIEELSYCSDSALLFDRLRDLEAVLTSLAHKLQQRGRGYQSREFTTIAQLQAGKRIIRFHQPVTPVSARGNCQGIAASHGLARALHRGSCQQPGGAVSCQRLDAGRHLPVWMDVEELLFHHLASQSRSAQ